jgi:hypothetical protein
VTKTEVQEASDSLGLTVEVINLEHSLVASRTYLTVFYLGHHVHVVAPLGCTQQNLLDLLRIEIEGEK